MPPETYLSPLDHWALKEYGLTADMIQDPSQLDHLVNHIMDTCDSDVEYWRPRNDRMLEDQRFWELGGRQKHLVRLNNAQDLNDEAQESEVIELNDGYLTVDKLTSMAAGAFWGLDVPPNDTNLTDTAQKIENFLRWGEEELNARHAMALNSSLARDEAHYACLRGWICGMILPNPSDKRVPWTYLLEDPLFVYPRYSQGSSKLIRVTHRFTVPVLEAREDYPEALEQLLDQDADDDIDITCYYDNKYKMIILGNPQQIGVATRFRALVQPLVAHGYTDIDGTSINPWIIVTPRGTPTRRMYSEGSNSKKEHDRTVAMIGLSVLHPIKSVIEDFERLVSQLHTEVAKGVNPPKVIYYDGVNKPEVIDLGIGAENYLLLNQQKVEILNTTAMKPDATPLLQIYSERLQKGSIPSVLYGQGATGISGYAINLLNQGAKDVIQPLLEGLKLFREVRYRRMLEMYANQSYSDPISFRGYDPYSDQMFNNALSLTPQEIQANGVYVRVTYDDAVPQERMAMLSAAGAAVGAGILPLYDALKDWVGIKDPKAALVRIAEGLNYKDPGILEELKVLAAERSGSELLKEAVRRYREKQIAMLESGMMPPGVMPGGNSGGGGSPPGPIPVSPSAVPSNIQPGQPSVPSPQDRTSAVLQQLQNVGAGESGGSPPSPEGYG